MSLWPANSAGRLWIMAASVSQNVRVQTIPEDHKLGIIKKEVCVYQLLGLNVQQPLYRPKGAGVTHLQSTCPKWPVHG